MKALDFLKLLHNDWCHFQTREGSGVGLASNSELKRWFLNGAVVVEGKKVKWDEQLKFPITSFVLFPKHPITLR